MADPRRQYVRELWDSFAYMATWLPGVPMRLGDVCLVRRGTLERVSSLEELGIAFTIREDETPIQLDYASRGAVSVSFKAAGEVPIEGSSLATASAGVTIAMQRENAVLFQVLEGRSPSIEDQVGLGRILTRRLRDDDWDLDHVVVTEVLEARSATILIASGRDARIELSGAGDLAVADLKIADAEAGLSVVYTRDVHTRIVAAEGVTPLFKARGLKKKLFGDAVFRTSGGEEFAELAPDDVENDVD